MAQQRNTNISIRKPTYIYRERERRDEMILTRFEKKLLCIFSMKSIALNLFKHPYKLKREQDPDGFFVLQQ